MTTFSLRLFILGALFALTAGLIGCRSKIALNVGDSAPTDVSLLDQHEVSHTLADFRGAPLLVYFYPKDNTPGCTTEACAFRDVWSSYETAGIRVVGVSTDNSASHARFAQEHQLPFLLLADTESNLLRAFGLRPRLSFAPRVSFLMDAEGVIRAVYPDVDPGVHAAQVLDDAQRLGLVLATN